MLVGGGGENGEAIAPGVQLDARMPGYERIGLLLYGYYAPSVVSFGDLDSYRDFGAAVSYALNRSAALSVGYRNTRFSVDQGGDVTVLEKPERLWRARHQIPVARPEGVGHVARVDDTAALGGHARERGLVVPGHHLVAVIEDGHALEA